MIYNKGMENTNYIDLHTHSIASNDGTYTPFELIEIAKNSNIKYLAITDHDSVLSVEEGLNCAKNNDIIFIPGIEISGIVENTPIHITAYGIDFKHPGYAKRSEFVKNELIDWGKKIIAKTLDFGFKFDPDEVYNIREDHSICEELIGQVILNDSRNDQDERLKEFRPGGKLSNNPTFNFYKEFTTPGKPIHVPYTSDMPIEEASKLIHESGGKMFLAHPNHNIGKNNDLLEKIISYGLDGVEVFSSYHDRNAIDYFYEKAKKYNLYMSVGSDFHGNSKPAIKMGSINYDEEQLIKTLKFIGVYNG